MRFPFVIALPVLALMVVGCRSRRPQAPGWVLGAPAKCTIGLSGETGWLLEQPQFQDVLAKFPLAEQSLDLFLKKARVNPHGETGRVSLFTMDLGLEADGRKLSAQVPTFLLQFQGFRDPSALQKAYPLSAKVRWLGVSTMQKKDTVVVCSAPMPEGLWRGREGSASTCSSPCVSLIVSSVRFFSVCAVLRNLHGPGFSGPCICLPISLCCFSLAFISSARFGLSPKSPAFS